ncbi:MAG: pyridoxamine 5'-phosphate oxidase family protein [Acidimicrobiia bacterium]
MPQSAFEYLSQHVLLSLATASKDGRPHAAPIFYVSDNQKIYFSMADEAESTRNIEANPVASVSVADVPQDWGRARGLQITGSVSKASGQEQARAAELFKSQFSFLENVEQYTFYRLDPEEIHYVHNDEDADEDIEALGIHWLRETVTP